METKNRGGWGIALVTISAIVGLVFILYMLMTVLRIFD
jgi:hypothetical protein